MKWKFTSQILLMTRYAFTILVLQGVLCSVLHAHEGNAQRKSIEEIKIKLGFQDSQLSEVFTAIEHATEFKFVYSHRILEKEIGTDITAKRRTLGDLLRLLSKETHLKFKRVDENIHVAEIVTPLEIPVEESISEPVQVVVSGKVSDDTNEPLPGVSVLIKGTSRGTTTNIDGEFSLSAAENEILQFSYIGFVTQEIPVGNQSLVNVIMQPDAEQLEEIVVVGYGSVNKRDLTGSVAQIDATKISNQSPNSVTDILRANVPGLNVGFNNSPKGVSELQVRGKNTLTAGSSPLIVVDGIIFNGDLSDINPADIDKVDVMKDASSAAVFGARGANGVVMITTKRGEGSAPSINLSSSFGIATNAIVHRPYSPEGYANWRTDVFKSINAGSIDDTPGRFDNPNNLPAGVTLDQWLAYDGAQGDPTTAWLNRIGFQDVEIANFLAGNSVDWYDQVFQTGLRNDHTISLSGTKDEVKYYWSVGYTNNEGAIQGEQFKTIRSRLNLESKINNWITVGTNTQFANRNESFIAAEWPMYFRASPWGSELSDDGSTLRFSPQDDPGAGARHPQLRRTYTDRDQGFNTFNSRLYTTISLPLGFSYQFALATRFEWADYLNHESSVSPEWATGTAFRAHSRIQEWQTDNIIKWNKSFGAHTFDATFLAYAEKFNIFNDRTTSSIFDPNDNLGFSNLALGTSILVDGYNIYSPNNNSSFGDQQHTGDALMGRLNYTYNSKYLLSATVRRDGYSAFGANNRRATFPSLALGWVMSDEAFLADIGVINFLKLRVSWGQNGNRDIGRYAALSRLEAGKNLIVDESGTVRPVATLANRTMENNDLQWERTTAWNYGLDFTLFGGKVKGSMDYYDMTTNDLLVERALPSIVGFSEVFANLGEVQNRGFELLLNTTNIDNENFSWNSTFNFSLNRNKIISLYGDLDEDGNELDDFTNRWFIGRDINEIWDLEVLGVYKTSEEEQAEEFGVAPGDFKLDDKDGDGIYTNDDRDFQGFTTPRFRWTFVNTFQFRKNLSLSVEMYSLWGQKRAFNDAKNRNGFIDRTNSLQTPYWTPDNQIDDYARLFSSDGSASFDVYRRASFIRLQNITLSYNVPQAFLDKIDVKGLRVYGNVRNVGVFAPHWDLFDPESQEVDGSSNLGPTPRFFTMGFNLTL